MKSLIIFKAKLQFILFFLILFTIESNALGQEFANQYQVQEYKNWKSELDLKKTELLRFKKQERIYTSSGILLIFPLSLSDNQSIQGASATGLVFSILLGGRAIFKKNTIQNSINTLTLKGQRENWFSQRPTSYSNDQNYSDQNTLTSRLKKLKKLLESGIITQEEYEVRKKEILEEFLLPI